MGLNKKIRSFLAVLTLAFASALPTQSFALTNSLYLAIDASGSIGPSDFQLQQDGYASALATVIDSSFYGNIAIGASIFASSVNEVFAMRVINNATDLQDLIDEITGYVYIGGSTALVSAIDMAAAAVDAFGAADNKVIDVSTDGDQYPSIPRTASQASADADALGITTNCIGIGAGADCSFATGFSVPVAGFADFEQALIDKLERELTPTPAPAVAMLLALGLVGMGVARRRTA